MNTSAWIAEILILRHQLAVLQRRQPRRPNLDWVDRALLATLLAVIPKARRQALRLLVTPDTVLRWHRGNRILPIAELIDYARTLGLAVTMDGVLGPESSEEASWLRPPGSFGGGDKFADVWPGPRTLCDQVTAWSRRRNSRNLPG